MLPLEGKRPRLYLTWMLGVIAVAGVACSSAVGPSSSSDTQGKPSDAAGTRDSLGTPGGAVPPMAEPPAIARNLGDGTPETIDKTADTEDAPNRRRSRVYGTRFEDLNPSYLKDLPPGLFSQLLPRDAIAPIYRPTAVTAKEAGLQGGNLVIGVSIDGQSRAYPIRPLIFREMVNDELGGTPILVTW